jgi:hypothetical protein
VHAITPGEMQTVRAMLNGLRKKHGRVEIRLEELEEFLLALHQAGFVVVERGTLLQFEKWWHKADEVIQRYRKQGLLEP